MGRRTNISKGYSLDTRWERTRLGKGEACVLVVYPDLIKFVPAPIIAEKKYIWNNFISVKCGRTEMVLQTRQTVSVQVDNRIAMWISQPTLCTIKMRLHPVTDSQ
jgi:hypothetical protein